MSDINRMFLIKLHPPRGLAPAFIEPADKVMNPANLPTPTSIDSKNFSRTLKVPAGKSLDFTIAMLGGIGDLVILPLGWPAGGCGGRIHSPLGDTHFNVMSELKFYEEKPDDLRPVMSVRFCFSGDGILTCHMHGIITHYNLNADVYAEGICVAIVLRDVSATATLTLHDAGLQTLNIP